MAVEHFDEGVYASNIWFGEDLGFQYRLRQLYAPPLLPGLIEGLVIAEMLLLPTANAPSDLTVMIPSLLAGCLTIPLVWWVVRRWLGPRAGVVASLLIATSDFHGLYSRTALTDVLLVLLMLLAIWLIERACVDARPVTLIGAGIASGLAWWTKYNGWLVLAISLCGLLIWAVAAGRRSRTDARVFGRWLLIAILAVIVWSPVLYSLQPMGGYAEVAANHKTYVVGFTGWLSSLVWQYGNLRHFDGAISYLGVTAAALVAGCLRRSPSETHGDHGRMALVRPRLSVLVVATGLGALASLLGVCVVLTGLSLVGFVSWYQANRRRTGNVPGGAPFAFWFLASWFFSLLLATPLYHPYPRLLLPWLCAAWMASGLGIDELARRLERTPTDPELGRPRPHSSHVAAWSCLIVLLGLWAWSLPRLGERGVPAWQPRTRLRSMAKDMAIQARRTAVAADMPSNDVLVYVYGEPALFFHLRRQGLPLVGPCQNPLAAVSGTHETGLPAILITGPHAHGSPKFRGQWLESQDRFKLLAHYPYRPSDLVLLNQHSPHDLPDDPVEEVRLYVVK